MVVFIHTDVIVIDAFYQCSNKVTHKKMKIVKSACFHSSDLYNSAHHQILYRENYSQTILSGSVNIFEMTEKKQMSSKMNNRLHSLPRIQNIL